MAGFAIPFPHDRPIPQTRCGRFRQYLCANARDSTRERENSRHSPSLPEPNPLSSWIDTSGEPGTNVLDRCERTETIEGRAPNAQGTGRELEGWSMSIPSSHRPAREWFLLILALLLVGGIAIPAWQAVGS